MGVIKERKVKRGDETLKELLLMSPRGIYIYALIDGNIKDVYKAYMDGDMEVVNKIIKVYWLPFEYQDNNDSNLVYFEDESDYDSLIFSIIYYLFKKYKC